VGSEMCIRDRGNMVEVVEKGQNKHLPIGKNYRDELLEIVNQNRL
jgi:hypothetical protein